VNRLLRWYLKRKIRNVIHHIQYCPGNAEVQRDGKSPDYWEGKMDGLSAALVLTGLVDPGDNELRNARQTMEGMIHALKNMPPWEESLWKEFLDRANKEKTQ
jgi:hypothetical protein